MTFLRYEKVEILRNNEDVIYPQFFHSLTELWYLAYLEGYAMITIEDFPKVIPD